MSTRRNASSGSQTRTAASRQQSPTSHSITGCSRTCRQKVVKAASRREAAFYLQQTYQVSERRAGQVLSLSNSSLRYRSRRLAAEELRRRLREPAAERPRYGYQRLWVLLRREGWEVNHKRVYRLYREEGLKLRKRRRRARASLAADAD
jgi:transposase